MRNDTIQEIIDMFNRDYPTASDETYEFFHDVLNVLRNVKSEWISVDERLPDDHKDVLVWFEYFRYGDYNCLFQRYGIGNHVDKTWYVNGELGWQQLRVIAWQKLPEPPESEE